MLDVRDSSGLQQLSFAFGGSWELPDGLSGESMGRIDTEWLGPRLSPALKPGTSALKTADPIFRPNDCLSGLPHPCPGPIKRLQLVEQQERLMQVVGDEGC